MVLAATALLTLAAGSDVAADPGHGTTARNEASAPDPFWDHTAMVMDGLRHWARRADSRGDIGAIEPR